MKNKTTELLAETTKYLAGFLGEVLPSFSGDWWASLVVAKLSVQQQRRLKEPAVANLSGLDLAGLLRILDQNWYLILDSKDFPSDSRHFVKEMQSIRNRWAHVATDGFSMDDVYRDLDTLQRFANTIGADKKFIEKIRLTKRAVLSVESDNASVKENETRLVLPENDSLGAGFAVGQVVSIKSCPSLRGVILSVTLSSPEDRYVLFVDGKRQNYYASQIQSEDREDEEFEFFSCEQFHAYLTALQIRYPALSTLYSLNAARIDFIPYQFRPVLKFIRSDRPRLLIADGVGVGKTIEAGLILRELQARRDIRSVLIICPRPLVTERKWQTEMKRFEERFTHLDGSTLRYCINEMDLEGDWPAQHQRVIIPYSLFDETLLNGSELDGNRQYRKGLLDLSPPPRFDLVIVDEAHHIRNRDTFRHKAVRYFCDHAEAVVFLTATPIQLGNNDLFVLLNILRPDLVIDQESFKHMAEPNPFINQAVTLVRAQEPGWTTQTREALNSAATTPWGQSILQHNPEFNRINSLIAEGEIGQEERVQLINDLEDLHTFSGIINRTRRRDIGDFTIRRPETVVVEFTPTQKDLHDELLLVQSEIFRRLHGNISVKFLMTTIRRQAASCLFGLAPFLEEILSRRLDELSWEEADNTDQVPQSDVVTNIESQIQTVLEKARKLEPNDPKLNALRNIIKDKSDLPNNKVMLFSSFRHTLHYLYKHLKAEGLRVGMIHGGTANDDRVELRSRFEMQVDEDRCLDVLLFSEIGCEGLDYQFCDCIINYDIPWNPMRIEQRIGRVDRYGQKSESVSIINLITPGTVDADIYDRCLMRIGVFNNAIGGSEEILGEITREIRNIAESSSLNGEERREKFQQLADNKIRLIQEQSDLEQKQVELFGIRLPQDQMKREIEEATSFWLSPISLRRLITIYLQQVCGKEQEFILGDKSLRTLRLSQESRNSLFADFQSLPRQNTYIYRNWENWLKGGDPHLPITFEPECALKNPKAVFIMPLHPFVKQAAKGFDVKKRIFTNLKVNSNDVKKGIYEFVIYRWQFHGIRGNQVLQPVASSRAVTEQISGLLEKAERDPSEQVDVASTIWEDLEGQHHSLWSEARAKHQRRTRELAEYRKESLATSHRARISLLEEQLDHASNEKIQKMRRSQIAAAEADYARRIQELEIAMERADVTAEPVAYGMINVEEDRSDAE